MNTVSTSYDDHGFTEVCTIIKNEPTEDCQRKSCLYEDDVDLLLMLLPDVGSPNCDEISDDEHPLNALYVSKGEKRSQKKRVSTVSSKTQLGEDVKANAIERNLIRYMEEEKVVSEKTYHKSKYSTSKRLDPQNFTLRHSNSVPTGSKKSTSKYTKSQDPSQRSDSKNSRSKHSSSVDHKPKHSSSMGHEPKDSKSRDHESKHSSFKYSSKHSSFKYSSKHSSFKYSSKHSSFKYSSKHSSSKNPEKLSIWNCIKEENGLKLSRSTVGKLLHSENSFCHTPKNTTLEVPKLKDILKPCPLSKMVLGVCLTKLHDSMVNPTKSAPTPEDVTKITPKSEEPILSKRTPGKRISSPSKPEDSKNTTSEVPKLKDLESKQWILKSCPLSKKIPSVCLTKLHDSVVNTMKSAPTPGDVTKIAPKPKELIVIARTPGKRISSASKPEDSYPTLPNLENSSPSTPKPREPTRSAPEPEKMTPDLPKPDGPVQTAPIPKEHTMSTPTTEKPTAKWHPLPRSPLSTKPSRESISNMRLPKIPRLKKLPCNKLVLSEETPQEPVPTDPFLMMKRKRDCDAMPEDEEFVQKNRRKWKKRRDSSSDSTSNDRTMTMSVIDDCVPVKQIPKIPYLTMSAQKPASSGLTTEEPACIRQAPSNSILQDREMPITSESVHLPSTKILVKLPREEIPLRVSAAKKPTQTKQDTDVTLQERKLGILAPKAIVRVRPLPIAPVLKEIAAVTPTQRPLLSVPTEPTSKKSVHVKVPKKTSQLKLEGQETKVGNAKKLRSQQRRKFFQDNLRARRNARSILHPPRLRRQQDFTRNDGDVLRNEDIFPRIKTNCTRNHDNFTENESEFSGNNDDFPKINDDFSRNVRNHARNAGDFPTSTFDFSGDEYNYSRCDGDFSWNERFSYRRSRSFASNDSDFFNDTPPARPNNPDTNFSEHEFLTQNRNERGPSYCYLSDPVDDSENARRKQGRPRFSHTDDNLPGWDRSAWRDSCRHQEVEDPYRYNCPTGPNAVQSSSLSCQLCTDWMIEVALFPCAHAALCLSCACKLRRCPFCERRIEEIRRIILP